MIIDALVALGATFPWFLRFHFGDSLVSLCASEDSRFLMGRCDVVHCVSVSLTGTIVTRFLSMHGVDKDLFILTHSTQWHGHWGPSMIVL